MYSWGDSEPQDIVSYDQDIFIAFRTSVHVQKISRHQFKGLNSVILVSGALVSVQDVILFRQQLKDTQCSISLLICHFVPFYRSHSVFCLVSHFIMKFFITVSLYLSKGQVVFSQLLKTPLSQAGKTALTAGMLALQHFLNLVLTICWIIFEPVRGWASLVLFVTKVRTISSAAGTLSKANLKVTLTQLTYGISTLLPAVISRLLSAFNISLISLNLTFIKYLTFVVPLQYLKFCNLLRLWSSEIVGLSVYRSGSLFGPALSGLVAFAFLVTKISQIHFCLLCLMCVWWRFTLTCPKFDLST